MNYLNRPWQTIGGWRVKVSQILPGPYGKKPGAYLYLIYTPTWHSNTLLYIGKTNKTISERLQGHIKDRSWVGCVINEMQDFYEVKVFRVLGNLDAAEKWYIKNLHPLFNYTHVDRDSWEFRHGMKFNEWHNFDVVEIPDDEDYLDGSLFL